MEGDGVCWHCPRKGSPFSWSGSGFTVGYLKASYKEVADTEEAFHPS